jgi:hypothetical protein
VPSHLVTLQGRSGLPRLPTVKLCLDNGGRPVTPASARLKEILLETISAEPIVCAAIAISIVQFF